MFEFECIVLAEFDELVVMVFERDLGSSALFFDMQN